MSTPGSRRPGDDGASTRPQPSPAGSGGARVTIGAGFTPGVPEVTAPALTLPVSGGAIRGIGEKFGTDPVTGTASMSVPVVDQPRARRVRPAAGAVVRLRPGQRPVRGRLVAAGAGGDPPHRQGPARATTTPTCSCCPAPRTWSPPWNRMADGGLGPPARPNRRTPPGYRVDRYRPRTEGVFARIERWTRLADGDMHWRSVTRDNVAHRYGEDAAVPHRRPGRSAPGVQLAAVPQRRRPRQRDRLRVPGRERRRRRLPAGARAAPHADGSAPPTGT